jgi:hypothetical protein
LGFHRIRYYGFLGARVRQARLDQCRQFLARSTPPATTPSIRIDYRDQYQALAGTSLRTCPQCHDGRMRIVEQWHAGDCSRLIIDTS